MTNTSYEKSRLNAHISQKCENRKWFLACINGNTGAFPYRAFGKEANIGKSILEPKDQSQLAPKAIQSAKPLHLVNVPLARPNEPGYAALHKLIQLFKNEAFGETPAESIEEIKNRFSLVIGVNQRKSIDKSINQESDAIHLKTDKGLFSRYDDAITSNAFPSALTLGYRVDEPTRPLIELGVKLDMACRAAMNSVFSYGAYFPETSSVFCVKNPNEESMLKRLTFYGSGRGLENRRLIQNDLQRGVLKHDAVFMADGGVTTTTPARMITEKSSKVTTLTSNTLKNKSCLTSLRNISQSHIFPKNWADNLYLMLGITVPQVTNVTGPMMNLFLYDLLSRMLNSDAVIKNYDQPLSDSNEIIRLNAKTALARQGLNKKLME